VVGFIAYPIIRSRQAAEPAEDERLGELRSQRETIYSAIEELKFDYEQGKLSLSDYQDLEKRYKEKAISILKEIDAWEKGKEPEDEIEEEVMRLRRSRRAAAVELVCPRCGRETRREASFCPRCGSPLPLRCPRCGATYEVGDRFCPRCGGSISQEGEHD
ncbi:MAG: zinc ribbon domain-containing protein, partial [Dehalococcoidia bacterium]